MIDNFNAARTSEHVVVVNINYESRKLDPVQGSSQVKIVTKGNGRVDSVIIREFDADGNYISSDAWFN